MKINAIVIDPKDNVATATRAIEKGEAIVGALKGEIRAAEPIPRAHKVAIVRIPGGGPILKYGEPIGLAAGKIRAGMHVHTHNVR